jgi:hypothetical protein
MGSEVNLAGAFNRKDTPIGQLPEKPVALGAKFFRELTRRIETIVPTQFPDNEDILVEKPKNTMAPGLIIRLNSEKFTLNVCSNGVPSTIIVFGPKDQTT